MSAPGDRAHSNRPRVGAFTVWQLRSVEGGSAGLESMTRLVIDGTRVVRSQLWPDDDDIGSVVLLPGGEAGVLRSWATDPDRSCWTGPLELRGRAP